MQATCKQIHFLDIIEKAIIFLQIPRVNRKRNAFYLKIERVNRKRDAFYPKIEKSK